MSTVLAEVAEEHSEKTNHAKRAHRNPTNHDSSARHGVDPSLKSHETMNLDKKKHHKIIVLKDFNPADGELPTLNGSVNARAGPLPKTSSNAMMGNGNQPNHVGPLNYSNRKSSNKLLFT